MTRLRAVLKKAEEKAAALMTSRLCFRYSSFQDQQARTEVIIRRALIVVNMDDNLLSADLLYQFSGQERECQPETGPGRG